jgi:predicted flap endonuclease-1-like 5' DNA nuclease
MHLDPSRSINGLSGGIIVVGNLEGGVGKSTLAVTLARAMARRCQHKVWTRPATSGRTRGGVNVRYRIEDIEGIGAAFGAKLRAVGIASTTAFLKAAATPADRKKLAETTAIDSGRILAWANMADLMRLEGVGKQFAELLEAAGVDTVKELRTRNAGNLAGRMAEVNAEKKLTRVVPTETMVAGWIEEAKSMAPILTY